MSKHDEEYINKFQPKAVAISDCCEQWVYPVRISRDDMYKDGVARYKCSKCMRYCRVLIVETDEKETN